MRDAGEYFNQLVQQVNSLDWPRDNLEIIIIEGDSIDGTPSLLRHWASVEDRLTIVTNNTGRPKYAHTISAERFEHLASIFNLGLGAVDCEWSDYVLFTPSDVEWGPDIIGKLIEAGKPLIAPMYWTSNNGNSRFYDTWGFGFRPMQKDWYREHYPDKATEVGTVGGMVLIEADYIERGARYGLANVDHGLCDDIKRLGGSVWYEPNAHIYHR